MNLDLSTPTLGSLWLARVPTMLAAIEISQMKSSLSTKDLQGLLTMESNLTDIINFKQVMKKRPSKNSKFGKQSPIRTYNYSLDTSMPSSFTPDQVVPVEISPFLPESNRASHDVYSSNEHEDFFQKKARTLSRNFVKPVKSFPIPDYHNPFQEEDPFDVSRTSTDEILRGQMTKERLLRELPMRIIDGSAVPTTINHALDPNSFALQPTDFSSDT